MFRQLYKQANEEIKGDKLIIEKAFQKAAVPAKKAPVFRYSFIGTCAAAVLIFGVLFVNSELFTDRSFVSENIPTENEIQNTNDVDEDGVTNDVLEISALPEEEDEPKTYTSQKFDNSAKINDDKLTQQVSETAVTSTDQDDDAIAMWSMDRDDVYVESDYDDGIMIIGDELENTETMDVDADNSNVMFFTGSAGGSSAESVASESEEEEELEVGVFSYMYEKSLYEHLEQPEYKNIEVKAVNSAEDAIERAKNECSVEYDVTEVFYDMPENMWKVWFYKMDTLGGDETVYLDSNGITQLIVYAE